MGEAKRGEKENKGGGGEGEKKKESGGGEKKPADGPTPVVFKVDMHCDGCVQKIKRAARSFNGVEKVSADMAGNKLTIAGAEVDLWKFRDYLEDKIKKKVELITPKGDPPVKKDKDDGGAVKKPPTTTPKDQKKTPKDQKKAHGSAEKVQPSTVALKLRLHCEGCIQRIKKTISKMKGVQEVSVDAAKELVTVKGTMDPKALPVLLKEKLKRNVEIVELNKGGGGGEKKEKGDGDGDQKKEKDGDKNKAKAAGGGGTERDKEEGRDGSGEKGKEKGGEKQGAPAPATATAEAGELNKMEYYAGYNYGNNGGYTQYPYPYPYGQQVQMIHAPQIFSDENPNACSVM